MGQPGACMGVAAAASSGGMRGKQRWQAAAACRAVHAWLRCTRLRLRRDAWRATPVLRRWRCGPGRTTRGRLAPGACQRRSLRPPIAAARRAVQCGACSAWCAGRLRACMAAPGAAAQAHRSPVARHWRCGKAVWLRNRGHVARRTPRRALLPSPPRPQRAPRPTPPPAHLRHSPSRGAACHLPCAVCQARTRCRAPLAALPQHRAGARWHDVPRRRAPGLTAPDASLQPRQRRQSSLQLGLPRSPAPPCARAGALTAARPAAGAPALCGRPRRPSFLSFLQT